MNSWFKMNPISSRALFAGSIFFLSVAVSSAQTTISWADIDLTGSSLADLDTRSASDLNTGTLAMTQGGFGADVSAAAGVPFFAAGELTFIPTTGTGSLVRAVAPAFFMPSLGSASGSSLTLTGTSPGTIQIPFLATSEWLSNVGAPWALATSGSPFNGVFDDTMAIGYNVGTNAARLNTSEPQLNLSFEANYLLNGVHYVEHHLSLISTAGVGFRPMSFQADREDPTNKTAWDYNISGNTNGYFQIADLSDSPLYLFRGTGDIYFNAPSGVLHLAGANPVIGNSTVDGNILLVTQGAGRTITGALTASNISLTGSTGIHSGTGVDLTFGNAAGTNRLTLPDSSTSYTTLFTNTGAGQPGGVLITGGSSNTIRFSGSIITGGNPAIWINDGGNPTSSNYRLQGTVNSTLLNVPTGGAVRLRINNGDYFTLNFHGAERLERLWSRLSPIRRRPRPRAPAR